MTNGEKVLSSFDLVEIADLVLRRTDRMMQSLALDSESFCRDMIDRYGLQSAGFNQPFQLPPGVCNSHLKVGPAFQRLTAIQQPVL